MAEQQNQNKNANAKEQDIHQLLKVRREKLAELQAEGKDPFQITKYDQDTHSADIKDNYAEYDGKEVSIAGRIMSKRVMGKASFCNVQDLKGNIQCYVSRDDRLFDILCRNVCNRNVIHLYLIPVTILGNQTVLASVVCTVQNVCCCIR